MVFATREVSIQDGQPLELYDITIGVEVFTFTNSNRTGLNFEGRDYIPALIGRSQSRLDDDQPGGQVVLTFATTDPTVESLTKRWVTAAPEITLTRVKIRKLHAGDTDPKPFWFGSISSFEFSDDGLTTSILCRALSDKFTLQGPRRSWGTSCNHQHYDRFCTLLRGNFTQEATVIAVDPSGLVFTVDALPAPTVRYNAGEFKKLATADSRLIVIHSGDTITVQYPLPTVGVGDTVEIIEGCEHNLTDCLAFSNEINYGGSPFNPTINPFTKGLDAI